MALIYGSAPDMSWTSTINTTGAASGMSMGTAVPWIQLVGTLFAAQGAKTQAKMQTQNLKFQGDIASLNARSRMELAGINASLSQQSTLLGAAYAEAMAKIQSDQVRYTGEVNAKIAEMGAQAELEASQKQVASLTLQAGQLKSRQKVAMAANGIDLGEGSAAEVQASTEIMKEIDKAQIEQNAIRAAWGVRTQSVSQQIETNTRATNIEIAGKQEAGQIRTQGARDLFSMQTQGAREAWEFRSAANANYAASNSISPDRAFASSFITGAQGVADSWYRWSKLQ